MLQYLLSFFAAGWLFLTVWVSPALAQEEEELEMELFFTEEETVTSAARHEQEIGMSPSAITVITREDIEASGATSLTDLLRLVPGMNVVYTTPSFTGVTARLNYTNENNHFLVLIDGREANVELLGQPLFEAQPISIDDVERIEVIRGPGSSLYGANALAGVISITTRALPEKTTGSISLHASEIGKTSARGMVSTRIDSLGISLNGSYDYSGLFTDHRIKGLEMWRLRAVAEFRLSETMRVLLDAGVADGTGPVSSPLGTLAASMPLRNIRLAFESEELRGQLYWIQGPFSGEMDTPLEFAGVNLAHVLPFHISGNTIDGDIQWKIPRFWDPLLLIIGGGGRVSMLSSDQMLDAETFGDITSAKYHQPGIDHLEARAGAFIHAELTPTDWVTITGGARFDYNTVTGEFISPRLSTVFRPASKQFIRLGASRAFRKPSFLETHAHVMVDFPSDSPITGEGRDQFQEFMTRVMGNANAGNEELLSFEAGYLGLFLDGELQIALDLFYNLYGNELEVMSDIRTNANGLPDLINSSIMNIGSSDVLHIAGGELSIKYNPTKSISLLATWAHRNVINRETDESPKNMISLGGRFKFESGFIGSLFAFARSEYVNRWGGDPGGILLPLTVARMPNVLLLMGKLGWYWSIREVAELEAGLKLMLPISPFEAPHFSYRDEQGGETQGGRLYGADELRRMVTVYLQGSF
jgi:iron complex outermembrane recepter protein